MKINDCKAKMLPIQAAQIHCLTLSESECQELGGDIAKWTGKDVLYDGVGFVVVAANIDNSDVFVGSGDWLVRWCDGHWTAFDAIRFKQVIELVA